MPRYSHPPQEPAVAGRPRYSHQPPQPPTSKETNKPDAIGKTGSIEDPAIKPAALNCLNLNGARPITEETNESDCAPENEIDSKSADAIKNQPENVNAQDVAQSVGEPPRHTDGNVLEFDELPEAESSDVEWKIATFVGIPTGLSVPPVEAAVAGPARSMKPAVTRYDVHKTIVGMQGSPREPSLVSENQKVVAKKSSALAPQKIEQGKLVTERSRPYTISNPRPSSPLPYIPAAAPPPANGPARRCPTTETIVIDLAELAPEPLGRHDKNDLDLGRSKNRHARPGVERSGSYGGRMPRAPSPPPGLRQPPLAFGRNGRDGEERRTRVSAYGSQGNMRFDVHHFDAALLTECRKENCLECFQMQNPGACFHQGMAPRRPAGSGYIPYDAYQPSEAHRTPSHPQYPTQSFGQQDRAYHQQSYRRTGHTRQPSQPSRDYENYRGHQQPDRHRPQHYTQAPDQYYAPPAAPNVGPNSTGNLPGASSSHRMQAEESAGVSNPQHQADPKDFEDAEAKQAATIAWERKERMKRYEKQHAHLRRF
ncbi:hypothetical protein BJ508DRAFT_336490 [Ascobolus immersus RN42]|uniref:Uncharacterized protein n=1 Tax=Ascobolus immersus RN42 TaxID=1160509 RepID=A0A3N4H893_ASCIM|nr:hypothetical protein BJ508DRAFT_336490 [Ascobolus immersus RN42]